MENGKWKIISDKWDHPDGKFPISHLLFSSCHFPLQKSFAFASLMLLWAAPFIGARSQAERQELGSSSYYRKWLEEDVYWIITAEERDVFTKLKTDEERDAFIEQFWTRRDPDPSTMDNEYKVEH